MTRQLIYLFSLSFASHFSMAQVNILDSCGVDSRKELNKYEIKILDSLFFGPPLETKKAVIDRTNGFDLRDKKVAFYSCTRNSDTKGDGLLSKREFFELCRPDFKGHAGRGIIPFNDMEKEESKGFDAVIIIDCPYNLLKTKDLISQLSKRYE